MVDWNEYAEKYEAVQAGDPIHVRAVEAIAEKVEVSDEGRLLDLGCGTGDVTSKVLEKLPRVKVIGVDPAANMRKVYLKRFGGNPDIEARDGDGLSIPVEDSSIGCVVSHIALHHVLPEKRADCASEIARVLKPGGKLVYADCFTGMVGPLSDRRRQDDIVDRQIGWAKYCLNHGANEKAYVLIRSIPLILAADGEYPTVPEVWIEHLESAGLIDIKLSPIEPAEFGMKIIEAFRI
ncbi:MAG: methyltransferase domain-containing protein [Actinobacteria bacterium]|nr:methyltransferase domain-containing protein [Actinomycetota bacterium]